MILFICMKVCWLSSIPSPYKMKMFELLGEQVELTAIIHEEYKEIRKDDWFVKNIKNVKVIYFDNSWYKTVKDNIKKCDIFIDSMYSTKYGIIATQLAKFYKKKIILHADGGIAKNYGVLMNLLISFFMDRHDYVLSSGDVTDKYFDYFLKRKKIKYHYKFSSISKLDIENNKKMASNKKIYKEKLGLNKYTILSVGQPIHRKGFDILLKAYKKTNLKDYTNLLIVGGKPEESITKLKDELNLNNVKFIDAMSKEDLNVYYAAADLFVLCTREDIWGLVINEALSFNLPVITSNQCVAGVHFRDLNSRVIIADNENIDQYAEAIKNAFDNGIKGNNDVIDEYSIENTADDIYKALKEIHSL